MSTSPELGHASSRARLSFWKPWASRTNVADDGGVISYPLTDIALDSGELQTEVKMFFTTTGSAVTPLFTAEQKTYVAYIKMRLKSLPMSELRDHIANPSKPDNVTYVDMFRLLTRIAMCAKSTTHFGVEMTVVHLFDAGILVRAPQGSQNFAKLCSIMFITISWLCMLYSTPNLSSPYILGMKESHMGRLNVPTLEVCEAKNSICETIQQFGSLLPDDSQRHSSQTLLPAASEHDALYVSTLNAKALHQIGNISVQWVDNLSAHLVLDRERNALMVFALPSYCSIYKHDKSTFSCVVADYYDDYSKPEQFTAVQYLHEIRLSYQLLFGDDKRAHKYFQEVLPQCTTSIGMVDPFLEVVCRRRLTPANYYSAQRDFPILGGRLLQLQMYMSRQNPGTMTMLWRDQRDMLRWYTFWVVTIIGGLSIILAFAQLGVGAGQLALAMKPSIPSRKI